MKKIMPKHFLTFALSISLALPLITMSCVRLSAAQINLKRMIKAREERIRFDEKDKAFEKLSSLREMFPELYDDEKLSKLTDEEVAKLTKEFNSATLSIKQKELKEIVNKVLTKISSLGKKLEIDFPNLAKTIKDALSDDMLVEINDVDCDTLINLLTEALDKMK